MEGGGHVKFYGDFSLYLNAFSLALREDVGWPVWAS